MQEPMLWVDEVRNPSNTYTVTENADHTKTLTLAGEQLQQGTNQSAANFNKMSHANWENGELAALIVQEIKQHQRKLKDLDGETKEVTMTNSLVYPFNNSQQTVSITERSTLNYRVIVELVGDTANVGEIRITDKQVNGFKIKYTGSAAAVTVKCYIVGGMYYG